MKTRLEIEARIKAIQTELSELYQRRKELDFALYQQRKDLLEKELHILDWVLKDV